MKKKSLPAFRRPDIKAFAWVDRRKLFRIFLHWYVENNKEIKGDEFSTEKKELCLRNMFVLLKPAIRNGLLKMNNSNTLHSIRFDMDDILNEVYLKLAMKVFPSFNRQRMRAFNHNNFYAYCENGIFFALCRLLTNERRRRSKKREADYFISANETHDVDEMMFSSCNYTTMGYNEKEMINDVVRILHRFREVFTHGEKEIIDYILQTEDISILGSGSYICEKFNRTHQFKRGFLAKARRILKNNLSIVD